MKQPKQPIKNEGNGQQYIVSGSISVFKGTNHNQRTIQSNSNFFTPNKDIIVRVGENKITFANPQIDYNGRTHKPKALLSGWVTFQIVADELPIGKKFEFDLDESNMDEVTIYFR